MVVTRTPASFMQIKRQVMQSKGENPPPVQHIDRLGANPPITVSNTIFIFGINSPTLIQGDLQAKRIDSELFDDKFMRCMNNTVE